MKQELIVILKRKKKEHQYELDHVSDDLLDSKTMPKGLEQATKQLVLKDKLLFHKSAILVLEDILQEVDKL